MLALAPELECELQAAQVERLLPHFLRNSAAPASAADLVAAAQEAAGGSGGIETGSELLPATLRLLWGVAAEWHLLVAGHHCDVFGFNLFAPNELREVTVQIFGDEDNRAEWASEHGKNNSITCAEAGWMAIASFSEYSYLYCCLDRENPSFGDVRHMVNNCFEEQPCCHIDALPGHLVSFVEEMAAVKVAVGAGAAYEPPDGATGAGLTRGLQCLRAEILQYGKDEDN
jgi:hypothetical protein